MKGREKEWVWMRRETKEFIICFAVSQHFHCIFSGTRWCCATCWGFARYDRRLFSYIPFSFFFPCFSYFQERSRLSDNFFFPFCFIFFFSLCLIFSPDRVVIIKHDKETKQRDRVSTVMLEQFEFHPRRATKLLQD